MGSCVYKIAQELPLEITKSPEKMGTFALKNTLLYATGNCSMHISLSWREADHEIGTPDSYAFQMDFPDGSSKLLGAVDWGKCYSLLPILPGLWRYAPTDVMEAITQEEAQRREASYNQILETGQEHYPKTLQELRNAFLSRLEGGISVKITVDGLEISPLSEDKPQD